MVILLYNGVYLIPPLYIEVPLIEEKVQNCFQYNWEDWIIKPETSLCSQFSKTGNQFTESTQ